jgi:hypothetical protein
MHCQGINSLLNPKTDTLKDELEALGGEHSLPASAEEIFSQNFVAGAGFQQRVIQRRCGDRAGA